jgi:hypothetical protein
MELSFQKSLRPMSPTTWSWPNSNAHRVTLLKPKRQSHEEAGWFEQIELQVLDWALPDHPVLEVVLRTLANKPSSGIV